MKATPAVIKAIIFSAVVEVPWTLLLDSDFVIAINRRSWGDNDDKVEDAYEWDALGSFMN